MDTGFHNEKSHLKQIHTLLGPLRMTVLLTLCTAVLSAAGTPGKFTVQWVRQFSSTNDFVQKRNLPQQLADLIFGQKVQQFIRPFNIITDSQDNLWVLDQGLQTISNVRFHESKIRNYDFNSSETFPSLVGLCRGDGDELYFTDSGLRQIFFMRGSSSSPQILNPSLVLNQPTGIGYSRKNKDLWIAETTAHRLIRLSRQGIPKQYVGKRGTTPGTFNYPTFICIDAQGLVYVVDSMNFRIQIFDGEGNLVSFFGESGDATGYLARPRGIAVDSYGHIYVVDALFHTVQIFSKSGDFLGNFGKPGHQDGEFWLPAGIFIDDSNHIYIADSYNKRIQVFRLNMEEQND